MIKTKNKLILSSILLALLCSCGNELQLKDGDTVFFPDTAKFLSEWKMPDKMFLNKVFIADSGYSWIPLDTFLLTYHMCDCPDWSEDDQENDSCSACNDYYLEEADSLLRFPWRFEVSGNSVLIYGRLLKGNFLPRDREFTVPDPPAWQVIRYYGYEIVRPYEIWGPDMKEFQEPSDTLASSVQLTIRR